jgi:hypothetical protein
MFSKATFNSLNASSVKLMSNLDQLEKVVRDYQAEYGDSAAYVELNVFENKTYGGFADFKSHTIGLLSVIMAAIQRLIAYDANASDLMKKLENAGKSSALNTALPEAILDLTKNLDAFIGVLKENDAGVIKLCETIQSQLKILTAELDSIKKNLPQDDSASSQMKSP